MRTLLCLLLAVAAPALAAEGDKEATATAPATDAEARVSAKRLLATVQTARAEVQRAVATKAPEGISNTDLAQWNELGAWLETVESRLATFEATLAKSALVTDARAPQGSMVSDMMKMNMEFLALQNAVQNESRKFQTLSNASKARHDTATNTIRNVKG